MNLTVNGQSQVPPGFRFHPTEEELLHYYLKKKVANQQIDLDVIQDVDLNKLEPWDIQEKCKIGSSAQNDWYFFSHKDKKYPTGTRTNRATIAGFWKATGRDKVIHSSSRRIGMRKTLVFYKGRAPHGEKSDWIMHEYRLDDDDINHVFNASSINGDQSEATEEGWVICRVFKKKNYVKALDSPRETTPVQNTDQKSYTLGSKIHDIDEIVTYMEKTKATTSTKTDMEVLVHERFLHLPKLQSPTDHIIDPPPFDSNISSYPPRIDHHHSMLHGHQASTLKWAELDRLVAYHLNGEASYSSNQYNTTPFFHTDDNGGLDEHTTSPTMPFLQSHSTNYNPDETLEDQIYYSTSPLLY
ncbi:hypothetical protein V2J09_020130 [Rumex salicifolius]